MPAGGARFHVALCEPPGPPATGRAGRADLVVLLHGFPQHWWAFRHQLVALAAAGHRTAAMDLRGAGASDKTPRGYDTPTLASDVAGVVRALGASRAVVVGQGLGGSVAWAMPALEPATTRAVAALSAPAPPTTALRALSPRHVVSHRHALGLQTRLVGGHRLQGDLVPELLARWAGPGWPSPAEARRYAEAMAAPWAARAAVERHRWELRSPLRRDGRRLRAALERPVDVPVLQLHGELDGLVPLASARPRRAPAQHRLEVLPGVGHFLAEEAPQQVTDELLRWLADLPT
ncbi:alpha/beta fold hydrolase [uncultured Pseudokineococcus sp.]|uniref:alpha/beta fold hydrolase n=1 Tax=uncultured Pseudokineococcus sp. TaxID=1642928 RepID=UPI00260179E2|nr:alpha/beta hydrolase [uncultured Pseudokineococcus sp.]